MKKNWIAGAVLLPALLVGAGASAVEGGWLRGLDARERAALQAQEDADAAQARVGRLDDHLTMALMDADTAQRATRQVRSEVVAVFAGWDRAHRRAARVGWTQGPRESRVLSASLRQSFPAASQDVAEKVELLRDVHSGLDEAENLLVVRGELAVEHALFRGHAAQYGAERAQMIQRARQGEGAGQAIAEEAEELAEDLAERMDHLDENPTQIDFHRRRGGLVPPVPWSPSHLFGPRKQQDSMTYVRHTGLTYVIDAGTEVRAVGAGLVALAERVPGYGLLVIVDHGGYHSLYAHLQEFHVEAGQTISDRTVLGLTGETGSLEGPKLYFELRRGGQPIDPMDWFIRRE